MPDSRKPLSTVDSDNEEKDDKKFIASRKGRISFNQDAYGAFHLAMLRYFNGQTIPSASVSDKDGNDISDDEEEDGDPPLTASFLHSGCVALFSLLFQIACLALLQICLNLPESAYYKSLNAAYFPAEDFENIRNATAMLNYAIAENDTVSLNNTLGTTIIIACSAEGTLPWALDVFLFVLALGIVVSLLKSLTNIYQYTFLVDAGEEDDEFDDKGPYWQIDPKDDDKKKHVIAYASMLSRAISVVLILSPTVALDIGSFFIGAELMSYSKDMKTLILKCLGVTFVTKLSNVFFTALVAKEIQKMTKKSSVAFQKTKGHRGNWTMFCADPMVKVIASLLVVALFAHVLHGDLSKFKAACYDYNHVVAGEAILPAIPALSWGHRSVWG